MAISIIGAVIGAMVLGASFYYFKKEKDERSMESSAASAV